LEGVISLINNPLNTELNPICHSPAFLGTHPLLHVSRIRVNLSYFDLEILDVLPLLLFLIIYI